MQFNGENLLLLNCSDRVMQVYEIENITITYVKEIREYVERQPWSAHGWMKLPQLEEDYIVACLAETGAHEINIFDTARSDNSVNLAQNMHSPLGGALGLVVSIRTHCHPIICVVTE